MNALLKERSSLNLPENYDSLDWESWTSWRGGTRNKVSTLLCSNFECSSNVRRLPIEAYSGFDVGGARLDRTANLKINFAAFLTNVRDGVE